MGRRMIRFWTALAFIFALVAVLWTVLGRLAHHREMYRQVAALEARVEALGETGRKKQRNLAKWYNYSLSQGKSGLRGAYYQILDFGDGAMAVLEVPALHLRLPICHGTTGPVGHDPDTPFPIGGRGNHTVLKLSQQYHWTEGQIVYIDCLDQRLAYRIESIQVMPVSWPAERREEADREFLTLIFDRGSTRTMVHCVRCTDLIMREKEESAPLRDAALAAASPLVLAVPALWRRRRYAVDV